MYLFEIMEHSYQAAVILKSDFCLYLNWKMSIIALGISRR